MVEMDVGHDDPAKVERAEPERVERRVHGGDAGLRTGLDQRGHRPVDQESGGELLHAAEQGVELMDPRRDVNRVAIVRGLPLRRRAGRLLGEQLLQRLQVRLDLGLIGAVEGEPVGAEPVLLAVTAGSPAEAARVSLRAAFRGLPPTRLLLSGPAAASTMAAIATVLAVYGPAIRNARSSVVTPSG